MNKTLTILAAAIAGTLGATSSQATTYTATLMGDVAYAGDGSRTANITSSSATWSYNDVTGLLSQTGATFNARIDLNLSGFTTMFRHSITGLVIGNGGAASASTFVCVEGNFGPSAAARTLGGDDMGLGPQQTIALYNGFSTVSWVGTTLTLSNAVCNRVAPGGSNSCATVGGFNQGYTWTLMPVHKSPFRSPPRPGSSARRSACSAWPATARSAADAARICELAGELSGYLAIPRRSGRRRGVPRSRVPTVTGCG